MIYKRKFLILAFMFIFFLNLVLFNTGREDKIFAISKPEIVLSINLASVPVVYTISFTVSQTLIKGDSIYIHYPYGTGILEACSVSGVCHLTVSDFYINNQFPLTVPQVMKDNLFSTVKLDVASEIKAGEKVTVRNSPNGFFNPEKFGEYRLAVSTSKEGEKIFSNPYTIIPTTISNLKATLSDYKAATNISVEISFKTGLAGSLEKFNLITIAFDNNFKLPSFILKDSVQFNQKFLSREDIKISEDQIIIKSPYDIKSGEEVKIFFDKKFGITTPDFEAQYEIKVSTEKEPIPVVYLVKIDSFFNVQILIFPQFNDGANGYYKTKPEIRFNMQDGVLIYYYVDDEKSKRTFDGTPVKINEGTHTFYYFFKDIKTSITSKTFSIVFKVDTIPPLITVNSPNLAFSSSPQLNISGSLNEDAILKINGKTISLKNYKFEETLELKEGENSILIEAEDLAGNKTSKTLKIEYKKSQSLKILMKINQDFALVNGKTIILDAAPFIDPESKRTLVPLRFIAEAFGANVLWEGSTQTITITLKETKVVLQIGKNIATINGKTVLIDQPPTILKSRTFVPVRFIAEAFKAEVLWNPLTQEIIINYTP